MATPLKRDDGTRQPSTAATSLPLELQQQIFSYLDARSFYAARKVCGYWRFASSDAVPLARHLRRLPILPSVKATGANSQELQSVFGQAARRLMLGVVTERAHDRPGSLTRASKLRARMISRVIATKDGSRTVSFDGRTISLFDTSTEEMVCLAQRPMSDIDETVGAVLLQEISQRSNSRLALSVDGTILAAAQDCTISIYNLFGDLDGFVIREYVGRASEHCICGLSFECDDYTLRVGLSGNGGILYLGTPRSSRQKGPRASMEHWKSEAGLQHTFLNSSLLTLASSPKGEDKLTRISGLQLLHAVSYGYLFAGQKHGGGKSSCYILGHIRCSISHGTSAASVVPDSVTIIARLDSFLSSWEYMLDASSERGMGLWENMPSAHEHHPEFALSADRCFVALAERDKKRIRPAPLTQLFVYRIPTQSEIHELIECRSARHERCGPEPPCSKSEYTIPRVPLCLSTIQGEVVRLAFTDVDQDTCTISATTTETTWTWSLRDH